MNKQHVQLPGKAQLSLLVINNYPNPKTAKMVRAQAKKSRFPVALIEEAQQGISSARNAALVYAREKKAEALIFLDDDDLPGMNLVTELVKAYHNTGADMITGPRRFHFPPSVPAFIRGCRVFREVIHPTGKRVYHAATNNLLIGRSVLRDASINFDLRFGKIGGGDFHFTRMCHLRGYRILWCKDAVIHTTVPRARSNLAWIVKRGYRVGSSWSLAIMDLYEWKSAYIILSYLAWRGLRAGKDLLTGVILWRPEYLCSAAFGLSQMIGTGAGMFKLTYREYA